MSKTAREIPRFADCGAQQNRYRFAKVRAGSADNLSARQWFLLASLSESRTRSRFVKASIENRREPQRPVVRVSEKLAYVDAATWELSRKRCGGVCGEVGVFLFGQLHLVRCIFPTFATQHFQIKK